MEVETIRSIHDLKAVWDALSGWRFVTILKQASLAGLAAGWTPQVFVPLVFHGEAPNPGARHLFESN
jgi:hypothetical protein